MTQPQGNPSESLVDHLAAELRRRWQRGQRIAIEQLPDYDKIAAHEEHLLDLIYHEVLVREQYAEQVTEEFFIARFPELRERLLRLFAVHQSIQEDDIEPDGDALDDDPQFANSQPSFIRARQSPPETRLSESREFRLGAGPITPPGYELQREVGRGGMAIVYRARHIKLGRDIALKMLLTGSHATQEVLARMEQEARAVAHLQHPGIVQIHEIGEHNSLPFLALEFVEGGTLRDWLSGQPIPATDAASVVEQLALTMNYAHERGVIHRDLKPGNILLVTRPPNIDLKETIQTRDRGRGRRNIHDRIQTKIGDFGLARMTETTGDLTATGQVVGTPAYMSPEQASGSALASPSQDIYALGVILYELLTGRPPFQGPCLMDTLHQVLHEDPVPPGRLQSRTPADLETICLKCLQKNPGRRYSTAMELASDLRRFLENRPILARPISQLEVVMRWVHRHPGVTLLTVATLLVTAIGMIAIVREADRANENESNLVIQRDEARRMEKLAFEERDQADLARKEAEANLNQAIQVVETLSNIGEQLLATPHQQEMSQEILNSTARFYEDILSQQQADPQTTVRFASALIRAAEVSVTLGNRGPAQEQLNRAIDILQQEISGKSPGAESRKILCVAYLIQGQLFQSDQRYQDARQAYDSCLTILDDLPEPDGGAVDQLSLRIIRANATAYLAGILRILGKQSESLAAFSDAIKQLRDLAAGQLEDDSIQFDLARCLTHYGSALRDYENNEQAVEVLSESLQMGEQILQRAPEDPHRISWQVFSLYAYALLDRKMERFEEGLEKLRSCERLLQTLIRDYPSVYDYQFKLAASLVQEIFFLYRLNDAAAAMTVWERFCHHLDSSVARFPNDLAFARWSSRWQYAWADELSERGRTDEAQWHWKQALRAGERLLSSEAMTDTERNEQFIEQARNIALAPSSTPEEKQRALSLARQATASSPNNRIARAALGIVLFENEQYEEARKELMVARGDQTGAGRLEQWYFAMTLWKLGFHSEARHHAHSITNDGEPGDLDRACINRVADRARKMISPGPSKNTNNQP